MTLEEELRIWKDIAEDRLINWMSALKNNEKLTKQLEELERLYRLGKQS